MRHKPLRLGGAIALLGLTVGAAPPPFDDSSIVVARSARLLSSDMIDATDPNDANAAITEWAHDAEFTVVETLSGPDLGQRPRIRFVDQREWRDEKLLLVVRRDGRGALWARRAWQAVGSELCLSAQQVAKLGLVAAFTHSQNNDRGQRCITV